MLETQNFLKNSWYVAAWDYELADGKLLDRVILEKPTVIFRGESGRVVALDNRCAHRGAKLSNGRLEGDCVRCMYHGLKFDPSGKCVQIPGQENIPPKLGVRGYPTVERDRLVWIWMGDPALADPAKILDFPYLRDAGWRGKPDYMHYDANYLLTVDNLRLRTSRSSTPRRSALGGVRLSRSRPRSSGRRRLSSRALAHGRRRAALPQEGRA